MKMTLTDQNFDKEVLESEIPVLVDFFALWCAPCRMIDPVIAELAEEFQGRIKVGKLDVDKNPETVQKYGVMSLPTLVFFQKGMVVDQLIGVQSKPVLAARIERLLTPGGHS